MEPTTVISLAAKALASLAAKALADQVRDYVNRDQRALDEAWRATTEDLLFKAIADVEQVATQFGRLDADVTELKAHRVWVATRLEALMSPDEARVPMLAAAFAGYFRPDIALDKKNRALRAAHRLEPTDVAYLRHMASTGEGYKGYEFDHRPAWDALMAAGCLEIGEVHDDQPTASISDLGRDVLDLLSTYAVPGQAESAGGHQGNGA